MVMPVDTTKVTNRRKVDFSSLQDVLADAERAAAENYKPLGNWSQGQIYAHLAKTFDGSIDGLKFKLPWYFRMMARVMKSRILKGPMPPGFKLDDAARDLLPGPTQTPDGLAALRAAIARQQSETKRAPSPVLGNLTVEEWNKIHLAHSALHMSFLVPVN
jgi:hypothetical protein